MGYTTEFEGKISIHPPLSAAEASFLTAFANSRRMDRKLGPYHVGQESEADVLDYNTPPKCQPGLWCQWVPTADGTGLVWDEGEKFYNSVEWMQYIIDHFLGPNAQAVGKVDGIVGGHTLNGIIQAQGEEDDDRWHLVVLNNVAKQQNGTPSAHTLLQVAAQQK